MGVGFFLGRKLGVKRAAVLGSGKAFSSRNQVFTPIIVALLGFIFIHTLDSTSAGEGVDHVLSPRPHPILSRQELLNLSGRWEYAFTARDRTIAQNFANTIIVPFPEESLLASSRPRVATELQRLCYRRKFSVPDAWRSNRILLHFEAVDWETEVWVNEKEIGMHQGGYDHFTFDITDALKPVGEQELIVSVFDPTEMGFQPRGKQMLHPREPFFHAASGIWQTVWLEPVPDTSVESLKLIPDIDAGVLNVTVNTRGASNGVTIKAMALEGGTEVNTATGRPGQAFQLPVPHAKLWSPDNPFLYDLKVILLRDGKKIDQVMSYFGMRKISVLKDESGFPRLMLNNKFLFQLGPLDQGYWPDGIYTAPSDEAMKHDIEVMKQLGFNMCRKHVKVEPERWYYWCDKLGLLVWQDMPNADRPASPQQREIVRKPESAAEFEKELKAMIVQHENHPSIVMWIPFNQGWGQYDTARITQMVKDLDPSRPVISASGWNDMGTGDVRSLHVYQGIPKTEHDGRRACVLGECGGLGLAVPGHMLGAKGTWNVTYYDSPENLFGAYRSLISEIKRLKEKDGLSGAVITQLTDVETELNGFMTYDRKVIKMPVHKVRALNEELIHGNPVSAK